MTGFFFFSSSSSSSEEVSSDFLTLFFLPARSVSLSDSDSSSLPLSSSEEEAGDATLVPRVLFLPLLVLEAAGGGGFWSMKSVPVYADFVDGFFLSGAFSVVEVLSVLVLLNGVLVVEEEGLEEEEGLVVLVEICGYVLLFFQRFSLAYRSSIAFGVAPSDAVRLGLLVFEFRNGGEEGEESVCTEQGGDLNVVGSGGCVH